MMKNISRVEEDGEVSTDQAPLILADRALESSRDSGFDLNAASGEPTDNSAEAGARRIHIEMFKAGRRCFRAVDLISDEESKLIAIDEEANHQIMHRGRFGKADRATHEPLDSSPERDAHSFLCASPPQQLDNAA